MSEGDDLQFQRDAAAKTTGQQGKGGGSDREHAGDDIGTEPITPWFVSVIDFAIGTGIATASSGGNPGDAIGGRLSASPGSSSSSSLARVESQILSIRSPGRRRGLPGRWRRRIVN